MTRHRMATDLLRTDMTIVGVVQTLQYKRELTDDDLLTIIENCRRIEMAARHVREVNKR